MQPRQGADRLNVVSPRHDGGRDQSLQLLAGEPAQRRRANGGLGIGDGPARVGHLVVQQRPRPARGGEAVLSLAEVAARGAGGCPCCFRPLAGHGCGETCDGGLLCCSDGGDGGVVLHLRGGEGGPRGWQRLFDAIERRRRFHTAGDGGRQLLPRVWRGGGVAGRLDPPDSLCGGALRAPFVRGQTDGTVTTITRP